MSIDTCLSNKSTTSFQRTVLILHGASQEIPVFSHQVTLSLATPWAVACQAPLSMRIPRQEYWSGLPFSPPGDCPDPGFESTSLASPALAGRFFVTEPPGKPQRIPRKDLRTRWLWDKQKERSGNAKRGSSEKEPATRAIHGKGTMSSNLWDSQN